MTIPPLVAEPIFSVGNFPVTNAIINAWIAVLFFLGVSLLIRKKTNMVPRGLQNISEMMIEGLLPFFDQVTGNRTKSLRFAPIVLTLFVFILFSNWIGLVPGTGSIGIWQMVHGEKELVPLLRPANSDLNMTLAMGIFAVTISHVFGIMTIGFFKHLNKFIQLGTIFKSFRKGGIAIFTAIAEFIVGIIEIIGEIAKMVSLSLRLFGNVFAGEVLLTVMAGLIAFLVPIPFMGLELLVGIIQATIFAMLTLVYLTVATMEPHGAH